ncbi:PHP domain-containing protein [Methanobrevibacter sp. TMH8]|uniref:CehA/McbA family metallohydrolase n=1 Tax=Methanobrevibacter sp. TMH8 TaxID=2848611 RepID=UPI001CCD0FE7|nr:PHP domain-containing protein [Methanobrevibacter sp. TMH8]MBZ9570386.1 PHP domain-containing protein [Methanobrevibacter sp. TMH8]
MKLDPHIHSIYSGDARSKPKDIIKQASFLGLDAIAISDHNSVEGSKIAIELSKNIDNLLIVPSIEISSSEGHILGFGVEKVIPRDLSPVETVERIHDQGGLAIVPHPFSSYRDGLFFNNRKAIEKLTNPDYSNDSSDNNYDNLKIDGVEVLNARYIIGYSNYKSNKLAEKSNLAKIGSSDSHFLDSIGNCYTEIKNIDSEPTIDDIIEAIKSKDTIAKGTRTSNKLILKEVFNKKIRRIY